MCHKVRLVQSSEWEQVPKIKKTKNQKTKKGRTSGRNKWNN